MSELKKNLHNTTAFSPPTEAAAAQAQRAPPAEQAPRDDLLWGAQAIADYLGKGTHLSGLGLGLVSMLLRRGRRQP